jgi:small subunit ribosomal protein S20
VPRIKSAIKRVEVTERNRQRNKSWKSAVRTVRTGVEDAIKASDTTTGAAALKAAYSVIDKAVAKGILHKNSAARKKSRLAVALAKTPAAAPTKAVTKTKPAAKTKAK